MRGNYTGLLFAGVSALVVSASASQAAAHVCMEYPTPRGCDGLQQKQGPCGFRGGRSKNVTTFRPGETITVKVRADVQHKNSWYRVSLNPNGDKFEDPESLNDKTGRHPGTLLEGVELKGKYQELEVTLPNIECTNCTMQVIQVMGDKGGDGFGGNDGVGRRGNDIYYSCADLVLRGEPVGGKLDAGTAPSKADASVTSPDAGTAPLALQFGDTAESDDGSVAEMSEGCSLGSKRSDASAPAWLLVGLGALVGRVRRQRRRA